MTNPTKKRENTKQMSTKIITFDGAAREEIFAMFDLDVDAEGYLVDKNNNNQRVLSVDGDEVKAETFAGIKNGSLLFFNSDLPSLIELADRL